MVSLPCESIYQLRRQAASPRLLLPRLPRTSYHPREEQQQQQPQGTTAASQRHWYACQHGFGGMIFSKDAVFLIIAQVVP